MKKTLIATAALLSLQATAVSAANVNIYGVIEEGILVQKADGANATTELKSAFDLGSRVGLKGSEDRSERHLRAAGVWSYRNARMRSPEL